MSVVVDYHLGVEAYMVRCVLLTHICMQFA